MHSNELDAPIPRSVSLRVVNPPPDTHFDPWMTWRTSWKCFVWALFVSAIGGLLALWEWFFAVAPLIFGALLGAFGLLGMVNGLLLANQEIRGQRFLVAQGNAVPARVMSLSYDEDQTKILHYEFTDNRGRIRRGSCRASGRGESLRKLGVGHELDVLYAPCNSKHFVPYATASYRVTAN